MASVEVKSPRNYIQTNTRRIIIHEKNNQTQPNGQTTPTITREIVIKENSPTSKHLADNSSKTCSESSTSGMLETLNLNDSKHPPSASTLRVCSTSTDRFVRASLPRSRSFSPDSKNVVFDPQPRSYTILAKSAGSNHKRISSRANIESHSMERIPLLSKVVEKSRQVEFDDSRAGHNDLPQGVNTLQRAKAKLSAVNTPTVYRLVPEDCGSKYQRFTYLPAVKPIPSSTPSWKVPILQRRNQQVIEDFLHRRDIETKQLEKEAQEKVKEGAIPEWKRPLVKAMETRHQMEKKKEFERAQMEKKELERFNSLPPWRQELIIRKKEQERLDSLPRWQRELVLQKRVINTKNRFEKNRVDEDSRVPWSQSTLRRTGNRKQVSHTSCMYGTTKL